MFSYFIFIFFTPRVVVTCASLSLIRGLAQYTHTHTARWLFTRPRFFNHSPKRDFKGRYLVRIQVRCSVVVWCEGGGRGKRIVVRNTTPRNNLVLSHTRCEQISHAGEIYRFSRELCAACTPRFSNNIQ